MAPRKRTNSLRPFVRQISELAASLPTNEDIRSAKEALDDILRFLESTRRSLDALPSSDDTRSVAGSIRVFDKLLDIAQTNPALSMALGVTPRGHRRPPPQRQPEEELERGKALFEELGQLTVDQIRDRLLNDPMIRLTDLRALAAHLHIRYQAKSTRESLAQSLTTRIANSRGYDALSASDRSESRGQ